MSNRVILTDTGCAPTDELVKNYGIEVMGMKLFLDDLTCFDGENIQKEEYYSKIEKLKNFNTNPPLVFEIKKIYENLKKKGYDEIVSVHVSSKMSKLIATCQNAKNLVSGIDIKILDTENMSIGAYFIVEKVAQLIKQGMSFEDIEKLMPEIRKSVLGQVSLSTLKYLVKNKRIGKAQGIMGDFLKMRPILGIDEEGYLAPLTKIRGKENVINKISDSAVEFLQSRPYNPKVYMTYGLEKNKKQMEAVFESFKTKIKKTDIKDYEVITSRMWPTIANLSGPATYAFAVYGEESPIE